MAMDEVAGRGVWTAEILGAKQAVCFDLEARHLDAIDEAVGAARAGERETTSITRSEFALEPIADDLVALEHELQHGRGLLVIRGFPVERYSLEELEAAFWGVGLHFGSAVSQSVLGDRLGHVIDVTDTDPHARAYRNNRLLLRLWMKAWRSRPQVPELKIFDGEGEHGIPPQPGRTPSYAGRTPPQEMPASAHRG